MTRYRLERFRFSSNKRTLVGSQPSQQFQEIGFRPIISTPGHRKHQSHAKLRRFNLVQIQEEEEGTSYPVILR